MGSGNAAGRSEPTTSGCGRHSASVQEKNSLSTYPLQVGRYLDVDPSKTSTTRIDYADSRQPVDRWLGKMAPGGCTLQQVVEPSSFTTGEHSGTCTANQSQANLRSSHERKWHHTEGRAALQEIGSRHISETRKPSTISYDTSAGDITSNDPLILCTCTPFSRKNKRFPLTAAQSFP